VQNNFVDNCSGLRAAMESQARRMQAAESAEQSSCSAGPSQACSDLTGAMQSETSYYRELQKRYLMCRRTSASAYPFSSHGLGFGVHSAGVTFDPLGESLDYSYVDHP